MTMAPLTSKLKTKDETYNEMQAMYDLVDCELSERAESFLGACFGAPLQLLLSSPSAFEIILALRAWLFLFAVIKGRKLSRIMQP